jgi:hypothetical protein
MASKADVAVEVMSFADNREKILKCGSGLAQVLASFTNVEAHAKLAKQLSAGRSLLRLGQHGNQLTAIREIVNRGRLSLLQQLAVVSYVFELLFLTFNNVALLAKWGFLRVSAVRADHYGTLSLVALYALASSVDVMKMSALDAKGLPGGAGEYHRLWRRLVLDLLRHVADFIAAVSNANLAGRHKLTPRVVGLLSAFSGGAACYINWQAAKEKVAKKQAKSEKQQ